MDFTYNKHYIQTDANGNIVNGFSDAFRQPSESDICINKQGGYQFRLIIDGKPTEENPPLFDFPSMIPLYKWDGEVKHRTDEELDADREAWQEEQAAAEAERIANDPTTLAMEMTVDHELRISMLEMGIDLGGEM